MGCRVTNSRFLSVLVLMMTVVVVFQVTVMVAA